MNSPTHKNIFVTSKSTTHKVLFWSFADMHRAAKKLKLPDAQLRMNGEMLFLISALILQTRALVPVYFVPCFLHFCFLFVILWSQLAPDIVLKWCPVFLSARRLVINRVVSVRGGIWTKPCRIWGSDTHLYLRKTYCKLKRQTARSKSKLGKSKEQQGGQGGWTEWRGRHQERTKGGEK